MTRARDKLPQTSARAEVDSFIDAIKTTAVGHVADQNGRLLFAMDATASRETVWDRACHIQGQMFNETVSIGGLSVQLAHYGGFMEFAATPWTSNARDLLHYMTAIRCHAGQTQIGQVLKHALAESRRARIHALVFVGDAMEEDPDALYKMAGELGILGVPMFLFQDGSDSVAEGAFRRLAELSHGAYCRFDSSSAEQLRDLMCAVAIFAVGGRVALEDFSRRRGGTVRRLTHTFTRKP